jgi:hypothetical protein
MLVGEARSLARTWISDYARSMPGFQGAFLTGSAIWTADDAPLAPSSDIDMMVVLPDPIPPVKLGKVLYHGVLLDVTYLATREIASADTVLGSYYLASSFARPSIVFDPTGRLQALTDAVTNQFPRRRWIERRCEHGWSNATRHFGAMAPAMPLHTRAIIWLFGTAAATIVLLSAGLRNPTVRTRYLAVRQVLADYGLSDRYESLLDDLGCAHLSREQVERHLNALEPLFDEAATVIRAPLPFASDISAVARPVAIDGSRDLIERGYHREAVFWIAATYARCMTILFYDGTPAQYARYAPGFASLLDDLGVGTDEHLAQRSARVAGAKQRIWEIADAIMSANPAVVA